MFASTLGVRLLLWVGPVPEYAMPAPPGLTQAIESIEVTSDTAQGSGFQITFRVTKSFFGDFSLLSSSVLTPASRIVIGVLMGITPHILISGVVSHRQLQAGDQPGSSRLVIMGRDLTMKLDEKRLFRPFPFMTSSAIVTQVLAPYALYGIAAPPLVGVKPTFDIPKQGEYQLQNGETDLRLIKRLAAARDWVFYIEPVAPLISMAHFGPDPTRLSFPQPALTLDMGAASNLASLHFTHDLDAPAIATAQFYPPGSVVSVPLVQAPLAVPPLAALPTVPRRLTHERSAPGYDVLEVEQALRARANRSLDCVKAEGQLDTLRYGNVLKTWKTVGVRGAGLAFDGYWAVRRVTHQLSRDKYTQTFSLSREGLYPLTPRVF